GGDADGSAGGRGFRRVLGDASSASEAGGGGRAANAANAARRGGTCGGRVRTDERRTDECRTGECRAGEQGNDGSEPCYGNSAFPGTGGDGCRIGTRDADECAG